MNQRFRLDYGQLPSSLPLFPLQNFTVMPGSQLPLNIFEPRYLNLVLDSLAKDRLIGMVQSSSEAPGDDAGALYPTGTAGRISSFAETADGRLIIALTGVCRFDVVEEQLNARGYRTALVDWSRFAVDYETPDQPELEAHERPRFFHLLHTYFEQKSLEGDWSLMEKMPLSSLVNLLISQLPFATAERQGLINAITVQDRIDLMRRILAFDIATGPMQSSMRSH